MPTGCASPASRVSSQTGEMLAFVHTPTGTTASTKIDHEEVRGKITEPVVAPSAIGADIAIGRATP